MDIEIKKNLIKLYQCTDKTKYNHYIEKLKKMSIVDQIGGFNANSDISANIFNIINNNFSLITDLDIIKNITYKLDQCNDDMFGNYSDSNSIVYKQGYKFNCFIRSFGVSTKTEQLDALYKFKKNFSLNFTDIFMQKTLSREDLIASTNFFCYTIFYAVNTFVENLIRVKKFGNKTDHLHGNIYALYKGGNTTRLIYRCFNQSVVKLLDKYKGDTITKSTNELNDLVDKYNIGDWDFLIKINFDALKDKHHFTDNELKIINKLLLQTLYYTSAYIKDKISVLLQSKNGVNATASEIQSMLFKNDISDSINKFISAYNSVNSLGNVISKMTVDKAYTYGKIIEKNNIIDMSVNDYENLYKKSFIFKNSDKVELYKNRPVSVGNYVETDFAFMDDTIKQYIPENLFANPVYIAYLSNMAFARRYALSSFNLIRIKSSNSIDLRVTLNNLEVTKKMFVNMELIDLSVSNIYDCKGIFNNHFYYPNYPETIDYINVNNLFSSNIKFYTKLPSPNTMFADICHMLFTENLFIWEDPKFEKRIKRLFFLSLPCMYSDKLKTKNIYQIYDFTLQLFSRLSSLPDVYSRLAFFNGHYEIITSPYNDIINEKIKHNTTNIFTALNITHKIVIIKNNSPYKFRYIEFLIANYIKMMIVANYIISNVVSNDHAELVRYELQIHRILELEKTHEYINPGVTTLTPSLSSIYKNIRGVNHSISPNQLVPLGPLPNLLPSVKKNIDDFMNDPNIGLITYEKSITKNCSVVIIVLQGMIDANINSVNTLYSGDSFF